MNLFDWDNLINDNPMHIATVTKENDPNLSVASDVRVIGENKILISVNEMNNTQKNIEYNPKVVLTTFDNNWEGLRMFGEAAFFTDGPNFELCKSIFDEALFDERKIHVKGAIIVTVNKIEEYK